MEMDFCVAESISMDLKGLTDLLYTLAADADGEAVSSDALLVLARLSKNISNTFSESFAAKRKAGGAA